MPLALGLSILLGCAPPPVTAPAPREFAVAVTPVAVVQRAAQRLTIDGFSVLASDATGGLLTATLARTGSGSWGPFIACRFADNSIGHANGTATLTVRLAAQAAGAGSKVFIGASTLTVISAGMLSGTSQDECASTGLAEQHVADAIAVP